MAIDRTAPDAVSGLTNKEIDAKVASAKTEGHAAGVTEGKTQAETAGAAATEAAVATAKTDAVKGERERIKSITALPEATGRETSALSLALTTDMSAEQIKPILAGLPKADATAGGRGPLGISTLGGKDKPIEAAAALTPDEVAASVNKLSSAKK